jgi:serralysin
MITTCDESYTAQSGETLATIADKVYENEELSTLIYDFNRDAIGDNPEQIEPGTRLVMPLQTSQDFTNRVIELTNIERKKAGLRELKFEPRLATAAFRNSQSMALQDYFSHTQPNGGTMGDRIKATGYQFSRAAENISGGQSTPEAAVQAWMKSPGHRRNILKPELQEIGVGYYFLAKDMGKVKFKHYWTQVFATPR